MSFFSCFHFKISVAKIISWWFSPHHRVISKICSLCSGSFREEWWHSQYWYRPGRLLQSSLAFQISLPSYMRWVPVPSYMSWVPEPNYMRWVPEPSYMRWIPEPSYMRWITEPSYMRWVSTWAQLQLLCEVSTWAQLHEVSTTAQLHTVSTKAQLLEESIIVELLYNRLLWEHLKTDKFEHKLNKPVSSGKNHSSSYWDEARLALRNESQKLPKRKKGNSPQIRTLALQLHFVCSLRKWRKIFSEPGALDQPKPAKPA